MYQQNENLLSVKNTEKSDISVNYSNTGAVNISHKSCSSELEVKNVVIFRFNVLQSYFETWI
jgi:hypothetical protein